MWQFAQYPQVRGDANMLKWVCDNPEVQVEIKTTEDLIDIDRDRGVDLVIRYGCIKEENRG